MPRELLQSLTTNAVTGRQGPVFGDGSSPFDDTDTQLAGVVLAAATTYKYQIPVGGASQIDVTLRMSAHTGTAPTPKIYKTLSDGATEKRDSAGASEAVNFAILADGVQQTATISTLKGERFVILEITLAAASTATIDQAEFSAL